MCVYITEPPNQSESHSEHQFFGAGSIGLPTSGTIGVDWREFANGVFYRNNGSDAFKTLPINSLLGFYGLSRYNSNNISLIFGSSYNENFSSVSTFSNRVSWNDYVFHANRPGSGTAAVTNARIAFYSVGESINLSLLKSRIDTLMLTISTLT